MCQLGFLFGKAWRSSAEKTRADWIGQTVFGLVSRGRALELTAAFFGVLFRFLCLFTRHVVEVPVAGKHSRWRTASSKHPEGREARAIEVL